MTVRAVFMWQENVCKEKSSHTVFPLHVPHRIQYACTQYCHRSTVMISSFFPLGRVTWPLLGCEGGSKRFNENHMEGGEICDWTEREKPTWATETEEEEKESSWRKRSEKRSENKDQVQIQDYGAGRAQSNMSESIRRRNSSKQLLQNLIRWEGNTFKTLPAGWKQQLAHPEISIFFFYELKNRSECSFNKSSVKHQTRTERGNIFTQACADVFSF